MSIIKGLLLCCMLAGCLSTSSGEYTSVSYPRHGYKFHVGEGEGQNQNQNQDPTDPTDPSDPVDPVDPTDPSDPIIPDPVDYNIDPEFLAQINDLQDLKDYNKTLDDSFFSCSNGEKPCHNVSQAMVFNDVKVVLHLDAFDYSGAGYYNVSNNSRIMSDFESNLLDNGDINFFTVGKEGKIVDRPTVLTREDSIMFYGTSSYLDPDNELHTYNNAALTVGPTYESLIFDSDRRLSCGSGTSCGFSLVSDQDRDEITNGYLNTQYYGDNGVAKEAAGTFGFKTISINYWPEDVKIGDYRGVFTVKR